MPEERAVHRAGARASKTMVVLLSACFAWFVQAHQEEVTEATTAYDCEHPPADAITVLPGLLGAVGRLACLPAGPGILANQGWTWRYTGSFFELPMIPAHAHEDSTGMVPPFYFTELSARELSADEAARVSDDLVKVVETYRPGSSLASMTVVDAINNYGRSITVFMPMHTEEKGWLIVCTPKCRSDYVIIVSKLRPN
ncbi:MAG: hypothetical protein JSU95_09105 [Betaproteobacteria bacterium]|nr:MAG: hypothetical protein JSU95_09105 [Betaproteobacteria bacterium]